MDEHKNVRTIWACHLPLGLYGRYEKPFQDPNFELWNGDCINEWVGINVTYSYQTFIDDDPMLLGEEREKRRFRLQSLLAERAARHRAYALIDSRFVDPTDAETREAVREAIVKVGFPDVRIMFEDLGKFGMPKSTLLTIHYLFRVDRKLVEDVLGDVEKIFDKKELHLCAWTPTVKDAMLLARPQFARLFGETSNFL